MLDGYALLPGVKVICALPSPGVPTRLVGAVAVQARLAGFDRSLEEAAQDLGATPFVTIGQQVAEGDTLMIVEAMKTMNHIPSPRAGTVRRILVEDGTPVEFGTPLMVIE